MPASPVKRLPILDRFAWPDRPAWALGVLIALLVLAYVGVWGGGGAWDRERVEGDFFFDTYHASPEVILLVVAVVLWQRRALIGRTIGTGAERPVLGLTGIGLAATLYGWAHFTRADDLMVTSLAVFGAALGVALGGTSLFRAMGPTLALLLLILPLPPTLMNWLTVQLQSVSTEAAAVIATPMLGEVSTTGDIVLAGRHAFHVIESCSGLRAIWTLVMAALVYGEVWPCHIRRRVTLVLIAVPIAVGVNALRIVAIMLSVDSAFAENHSIQGIVALVVGILVLHAIHLVLEALDRLRPRGRQAVITSGQEYTPGGRAAPSPAVVGTILVVLIAMNAVRLLAPRWEPPAHPESWSLVLPRRIPPFEARRLPLDDDYMGSIGYDRYVHRAYLETGRSPEEAVRILAAYQNRLDRSRSILSPRWRRPGAAFEIHEEWVTVIDGLPSPVSATLSSRGQEWRITYSWYEESQGFLEETLRSAMAIDHSPWRRTTGVLAVRVDTTLPAGMGGRVAASRRLEHFLKLSIDGSLTTQKRDGASATKRRIDRSYAMGGGR